MTVLHKALRIVCYEKSAAWIAYGEITKKKRRKSGVNVSVYNPKRILIDGMSYNEILYKDIIKNI